MSWDPTWETIYQTRGYNHWPSEEVIGFILRHYGKVPDRRAVKVLELGSGQGANLWFLAKEGFDAYGIEGSEKGVNLSDEMLRREGLQATVIAGKFLDLASYYAPASFDAITDMGSLQHNRIEDMAVILSHCRTLLKSGGRIFSRILQDSISPKQLEGWGYVRPISLDEAQRLFSVFQNVRIEESLRSVDNRQHWAKRWVIEAMKSERA